MKFLSILLFDDIEHKYIIYSPKWFVDISSCINFYSSLNAMISKDVLRDYKLVLIRTNPIIGIEI